jgi:predicted RNase H-like HicB family nuclease
MAHYLTIIERANANFSAYSPDLPGCIATGKTQADVTRNMRDAIEMHLQGLREEHLPIPEPSVVAEYVTV